MKKRTVKIANVKYILLTLFFFSLFVRPCIAKKETNVIGKMEFKHPRYFALVKNTGTSEKNVYREEEVIYFNNKRSNYFKILDVKEKLVVGINKNGKIVSLSQGNYLSDNKKLKFIRGIEVKNIRFSYIYGDYDKIEFEFSDFNNNSLTLSRSYNPTNNGEYRIGKELIKEVNIEKSNTSKVIVDRETVQPVLNLGQKIVKDIIEKKDINLEKGKTHQALNVTLSNSAAKIVVGSSGILVKRFYLKKLPKKIDLKQGDFIKRINGEPINSLRDVYYILKDVSSNKKESTIKVDLIRNYRIMTKYYNIK